MFCSECQCMPSQCKAVYAWMPVGCRTPPPVVFLEFLLWSPEAVLL
jgi:hypothetical protein